MADQHVERATDEPDPRRWRILLVTMAVGFMSLLDVSIVNIAIPSIERALGARPAEVQWVVSGYALTFGLTLVTGGRLGDALGRQRMMLVGLTGFIASSALCGFAGTIELLIAGRLLQGAFSGLLVPQNSGTIQQYFSGAERGKAFGYMGMTVGIATAIGPVLGGLIISAFGGGGGWRWIFLVNLPIGLVMLVAISRVVPGLVERSGPIKLDPLGAVLLGLTVVAVIYPVSVLEQTVDWRIALFAGVPILGALTVWWERRCLRTGREPLLDVRLLAQTPGYASGMLLGMVYFTGFSGVLLVYSVFLQDGLGLSTLGAGVLLTPFAVASATGSFLAGRVVSRIGRRTTVIALAIMMSGLACAAVAVPVAQDGRWLRPAIIATMLIAGFGAGGVVSPNLTMTLAHVPPRMGGAAGAAVQTGQRMGNAMGATMMLTLFNSGTRWAGGDSGIGLRTVLFAAVAVLSIAFALAVYETRAHRKRTRRRRSRTVAPG